MLYLYLNLDNVVFVPLDMQKEYMINRVIIADKTGVLLSCAVNFEVRARYPIVPVDQ